MELTLTLFTMLIGLTITTAQFPEVGKKPEYFWNDEDHPRKETTSCKCGIAKTDSIPWNVFVHVDEKDTVRECIGTIITSNLVVTSHKCLTRKGSHINIFDTWTPPIKNGPKNMVNASSVLVTTTREKTEATTFQVTKLIFNSLYAVSLASNAFPEQDFALLQVKADFTTETDYPICVSRAKDVDKLELFSAVGFHYGIEGSTLESTPKQNETALLDYLGGTVVPTKDCNEALEKHEKDAPMSDLDDESPTLCFQFGGGRTPPDGEGGPIIIRSHDTSREFLVGIVSHLRNGGISEMKMGLEYSYFSSAIPMIKYFDLHAAEAQSTWCQSSELNLVRQDSQGRSGPWPWDLGHPIEREESLNCVCGKPNTDLSGRIVGGVEATPYEFGWMVLLRIYTRGRFSGASHSICGGSIISDRVILTAAHCLVMDDRLHEKLLSKMTVKPENIDVYSDIHRKNDRNSIRHKVQSVLFHPGYAEAKIQHTFDYDIALLILAQPITLVKPGEKGIKPICLTKSTAPYIDLVEKKATVTGWGLTNPDDDYSTADALQKIELPIAPLSLCRSIASVTDRFICAGTLNKYKDAAGGDSGGPLMIKNEDGRWLQVGLVSYGEEVHTGHSSKTAALYTDVQQLIRFIDYHSQKAGAQWCQTSDR